MSAVPSIKGSAFASLAESVRELVAGGRLSRADLARRLEPGELDVVEGQIGISQWYDVRLHVRLLQVLEDVGGPGHIRQVVERTADRILAAGLYQQLNYLSRTQLEREREPGRRLAALATDLRLVVSLSSTLLNFSRWEPKPDPEYRDRYMIEISGAAPLQDLHLASIEAFMNRVSSPIAADLWRRERKSEDQVLFRMTRGVDAL
jgi:hypothetical protein